MYSLKALLYATLLVTKVFTALIAPSITNPPHDTDSKGSSKSKEPVANKAKSSET